MKELILQVGRNKRIEQGHLWIYSNEVNVKLSPLKSFENGELVLIKSHDNKKLGIGYINPNNLLCVRVLTHQCRAEINTDFFIQRISDALELRKRIFSQDYYRLVFGESDYLPGLVIDRFDDVAVVQLNTAGMERLKDFVIEAVVSLLHPRAVLLKNSSSERAIEGLSSDVSVVHGELKTDCFVKENGCEFTVPLLTGQKTGWFYDQRKARSIVAGYCNGKRVLDLFSYVGAFSIPCARLAKEVVSVDRSAEAISFLKSNLKLNHCENVTAIQDDVIPVLETMHKNHEKFDVIICDPPAYIKKRKDIVPGMKGYTRLNQFAMRLLNPKGILFTASCSMQLDFDMLLQCVNNATAVQRKEFRILERTGQDVDHPVHPLIPETHYLKGFVAYFS